MGIQDVSQLPPIDSHPVFPDQTLQSSGHIRGWVDIVGFKNTVNIFSVNYVSSAEPIVKYGVWGEFPKGNKCYTCTIDYITKDLKITVSGEYATATLNLKMLWHETLCTQTSCTVVYTTETASFTDTEQIPQIFFYKTTQNVTIQQFGGVVPKNIMMFEPMYGITNYT